MAETANKPMSILSSISLVVAMVFFFLSSFFKEQFGNNNIYLKIVVVIALSLLAILFTTQAQKLKVMLEKMAHMHIFMKAIVHFVLLELASVVIFLNKYPRFKTHDNSKGKTKIQLKTSQGIIFGSRCYLFSVAAFSAHSLLLSCNGDQTMKLGISDFFLELTMEASMGIPDNNGQPNLWYVVGAATYCFLLILYKSSQSSSDERYYHDLERGVADRRSGHIRANLSDNTSSIIEIIIRGSNIEEDDRLLNNNTSTDEEDEQLLHYENNNDFLGEENLQQNSLISMDGLQMISLCNIEKINHLLPKEAVPLSLRNLVSICLKLSQFEKLVCLSNRYKVRHDSNNEFLDNENLPPQNSRSKKDMISKDIVIFENRHNKTDGLQRRILVHQETISQIPTRNKELLSTIRSMLPKLKNIKIKPE